MVRALLYHKDVAVADPVGFLRFRGTPLYRFAHMRRRPLAQAQ